MTERSRRRRPSPALLISILALVMAMGGSSIAQDVVADISAKISGKRIAKNAIKSKHIKNGGVKAKDLAAGVVPDAYTKTESDGKYEPAGDYLAANGKAADSEQLDGIDSSGFLRSDGKAVDSDKLDGLDSGNFMQGQAYHGSRSINEGAGNALITVADIATINASCADADDPAIEIDYLASFDDVFWRTSAGVEGHNASVTAGTANQAIGMQAASTDHATIMLTDRGAGFLGGSVVTKIEVFTFGGGDNCRFAAIAESRDSRFVIFVPPIIFPKK